MGNNIFQKRVQAITPKILSDERIFVYIPRADNLGSHGIAAFDVNKTEDGDVLLGDFIVSNKAIVSLNNEKYYTKTEIIEIYQRLDNLETGSSLTDSTTKYPSSHTVKSYVDALNATLRGLLEDEEDARVAADNTLQDNIDSEAQARAAADNTLTTNLNTEITNRTFGDTQLRTSLNSEISVREMSDANITNSLNAEVSARTAGDSALTTRIAAEESARANADSELDTRTSDIEELIPVQATSQNQLADKSYVNSIVATIQSSKTFTFDTFVHFESWLSREYERADNITIDDLMIGNFILIEETDVPDYWCKSITKTGNIMTVEDNFSVVEVHIDLTPYQKKLQFDVLPTPTAQLVGQIYQYIGTTTSQYTNGKFYKVVYKSGVYKYEEPDYRPIVKPASAPTANTFIYVDSNNAEHYVTLDKGLAIVDGKLQGGLELVE